jgi:hypothetical protein
VSIQQTISKFDGALMARQTGMRTIRNKKSKKQSSMLPFYIKTNKNLKKTLAFAFDCI